MTAPKLPGYRPPRLSDFTPPRLEDFVKPSTPEEERAWRTALAMRRLNHGMRQVTRTVTAHLDDMKKREAVRRRFGR